MPARREYQAGTPAMSASRADLREVLWRAADKLRGSMDAAQYKDFVLGLVFLKHVSDSFERRRARIRADALAGGVPEAALAPLLDDVAAYRRAGVFWVPENARWGYIAAMAERARIAASGGTAGIGALIDGAMDSLMTANPALAGTALARTAPKIFSRGDVDQRRLAELASLIGDARLTSHGTSNSTSNTGEQARDMLGEVYEYFLDKFARAEGRRGGEFYTPRSVVKLLVEVLEPYAGRVYDPCCGSGGMFVQAEKFVLAHQGERGAIAVYGQESNERTWRLAHWNLAIHQIAGNLGSQWADTFRTDEHPGVTADFILANPPFNMSDWARRPADPRWKFGVPPAGNANFAWLEHIVSKLGPRGVAGVVLANGSMSSRQSGEGEIRAALVEADLLACMIALPPQLFRSTRIPACLWFLAKDKSPQGDKSLRDVRGEILFIDARSAGTMAGRTERVLTDGDIAAIAGAYHAWRGTPSARAAGRRYADIPAFCYSATLDEVREHEHILTPGRYVGVPPAAEGDGEPLAGKTDRLKKELFACFEESARLEQVVRERLEHLDT